MPPFSLLGIAPYFLLLGMPLSHKGRIHLLLTSIPQNFSSMNPLECKNGTAKDGTPVDAISHKMDGCLWHALHGPHSCMTIILWWIASMDARHLAVLYMHRSRGVPRWSSSLPLPSSSLVSTPLGASLCTPLPLQPVSMEALLGDLWRTIQMSPPWRPDSLIPCSLPVQLN